MTKEEFLPFSPFNPEDGPLDPRWDHDTSITLHTPEEAPMPMNAAQKASKARLRYADQQLDAWNAAYDALDVVQSRELVDTFLASVYHDSGWPISGDDLALAKAGKIA